MATRPFKEGRECMWRSVELRYLRTGQPRPYADTVDEFLAIFSGGCPSNKPGEEISFATMPPEDPTMWDDVVWSTTSYEEQARARNDKIKSMVRPLAPHPWDYDATVGESGSFGQTVLAAFELVQQREFATTYRFVVTTPYCG